MNVRVCLISVTVSALVVFAAGCASSPQKETESPRETQTRADTAEKPASGPSTNGHSSKSDTSAVDLPAPEKFDRSRAYVATIGTGTITALDLESNTVAWTLKVSEGTDEHKAESAMGIAASHDGSTVFTGNVARDELVDVDADNQEITKRVPLDHHIHAIDICPHGHWLWVAGRTPNFPWLSATTIVNAKTLEKVATVSSGLGNAAHFNFAPDGKTAWAASVSTNLVWAGETKSGEVTKVVPTGEQSIPGESPEGKMGLLGLNEVALTPDGERAFAVGPETGTVYAIDVRTGNVVGEVDVGERTHGVAVTRDGEEVWTANNAGTVTVVVDRNEVAAEKLTWNQESGDSHHRSGQLVVDTQADPGSTARLVLVDLGVPSREFESASFP